MVASQPKPIRPQSRWAHPPSVQSLAYPVGFRQRDVGGYDLSFAFVQPAAEITEGEPAAGLSELGSPQLYPRPPRPPPTTRPKAKDLI